jgi:hypothetical protein
MKQIWFFGRVAVLAGLVVSLVLGFSSPASAHVMPTSTVVLEVHEDEVQAQLRIPLDDFVLASGIELAATQDDLLVQKHDEIVAYIAKHFVPTSDEGKKWRVTVGDLGLASDRQLATGPYGVITATAHLVPPAGSDIRRFNLGYDVVIHQVVTHVAIVSVLADWDSGVIDSARELGTIQLDSSTGQTTSLHVDLGQPNALAGFLGMLQLGGQHILEGVDHQLFLLALLLPAGLLVVAKRWGGPTSMKRAFRKIALITLSFTIGHSITLALGALGLPVPQQIVEATIAISIVVAAAHALNPLFPGREAFVAGGFGLIHGLAFSVTLQELQLSQGQLVLSLLGFNLGIELMQLLIVILVLPPLVIIARTPFHNPLRIVVAGATIVAATGWLVQRLGVDNDIASLADGIGAVGPFIIGLLWLGAMGVLVSNRARVA